MAGAAASYKTLLSKSCVIRAWLRGGAELPISPSLEGCGRIGDDRENHMGVLLAAILRALAAIDAWPVGLEPGDIGFAGNQFDLPPKNSGPQNV